MYGASVDQKYQGVTASPVENTALGSVPSTQRLSDIVKNFSRLLKPAETISKLIRHPLAYAGFHLVSVTSTSGR